MRGSGLAVADALIISSSIALALDIALAEAEALDVALALAEALFIILSSSICATAADANTAAASKANRAARANLLMFSPYLVVSTCLLYGGVRQLDHRPQEKT